LVTFGRLAVDQTPMMAAGSVADVGFAPVRVSRAIGISIAIVWTFLPASPSKLFDVGRRHGEQVEHVQIDEERIITLTGKTPVSIRQLPHGLCRQRAVVRRRADADVDRRRRQVAREHGLVPRPSRRCPRCASRHRTV
jgi:hypothetical protein